MIRRWRKLEAKVEGEGEQWNLQFLLKAKGRTVEYSFEKLIVWQKAMTLARLVYDLTKTFPVDERYGLTDQLRRAIISVPSNIAEGYGRASNKDYAHFLAIARGSLYEALTQIKLAQHLGYCNENLEVQDAADEVARMLGAMLKKHGAIQSNSPSSFASQEGDKYQSSPSPSSFA